MHLSHESHERFEGSNWFTVMDDTVINPIWLTTMSYREFTTASHRLSTHTLYNPTKPDPSHFTDKHTEIHVDFILASERSRDPHGRA